MQNRKIKPESIQTSRLVKNEDLNHHGTLFAGRTAEWFVESGFIAAASLLDPKKLLCLKIHGMHFTKSVYSGQILTFSSKIIYAGRSSLVSFIRVNTENNNDPVVMGFITFIHVDENSNPSPHNFEIIPESDEDIALFNEAKKLGKK